MHLFLEIQYCNFSKFLAMNEPFAHTIPELGKVNHWSLPDRSTFLPFERSFWMCASGIIHENIKMVLPRTKKRMKLLPRHVHYGS